MNLALVTNLFPPLQTGTSYYTRDLARSMSERGHDVVVVTCAGHAAAGESVEDGVRVVRLPSLTLPTTRLSLGFDEFHVATRRSVSRALREVLADHRSDVVHQCGHLLDLTYFTPTVAKRLDIPSACSIHTVIHFPGRPLLNRLAGLVDAWALGRGAMRRYDALLALDAEMQAYAARRYRHHNVVRVPWGIDFDFAVEKTSWDPGPLHIVSIGHVTEMRSRAALIEAMRLLRDEGITVRLRIIGKECTPRPRASVESLGLDEQVTFTGELPRAQVIEELRRAHIEANWITNRSVGSAGMEAMAMGLPTMLWAEPDTLGFARLGHLENALLIDPADAQGIAQLLRKLDADRDLLKVVGRAARRTARDHFTWPAVAGHMETVYERLVRRHGGASAP